MERSKTPVVKMPLLSWIFEGYDKIGVMKSGKIKEMGTYQELIEKKGLLYELISGKR